MADIDNNTLTFYDSFVITTASKQCEQFDPFIWSEHNDHDYPN
jgi:hypothetical protein